jgi:hypothetical protein
MMELDFRSVQLPSLKLTFENGDVIHVMPPTKGMLNRLRAMEAEAKSLYGKSDKETMHKVYDLFAELMSANEEGITLTGKDLNLKYHLKLLHIITFREKYIAFVQSITNAKN